MHNANLDEEALRLLPFKLYNSFNNLINFNLFQESLWFLQCIEGREKKKKKLRLISYKLNQDIIKINF